MTDVQCLFCGSGNMDSVFEGVMRCWDCFFTWKINEFWNDSGRKEQKVFLLSADGGKWIEVPMGCLLVAASEAL